MRFDKQHNIFLTSCLALLAIAPSAVRGHTPSEKIRDEENLEQPLSGAQTLALARQHSSDRAQFQNYNHKKLVEERMQEELRRQQSQGLDEDTSGKQKLIRSMLHYKGEEASKEDQHRGQRYEQMQSVFKRRGWDALNEKTQAIMRETVPRKPWKDSLSDEASDRLEAYFGQGKQRKRDYEQPQGQGRKSKDDINEIIYDALRDLEMKLPPPSSAWTEEQKNELRRDLKTSGPKSLPRHLQHYLQAHDDGPDGPLHAHIATFPAEEEEVASGAGNRAGLRSPEGLPISLGRLPSDL